MLVECSKPTVSLQCTGKVSILLGYGFDSYQCCFFVSELDDTWYASVKLFLRPFDIPPKAVKFNYTLDNYKELVSDSRECISNFEVDEIFSECKVRFLTVKTLFELCKVLKI